MTQMSNEPSAKFEISECYLIHDNHIIVSGEIIEGKIQTGDVLSFEFDGKAFVQKIVSVVLTAKVSDESRNFDVVIRCDDGKQYKMLKSFKPNQIIANIYSNKG